MSKNFKILTGVLIAAAILIATPYYRHWHLTHNAGLLSETIDRRGDIWDADFSARLVAPEPQVFAAIRNMVNREPGAKSVRVISQSKNARTVEVRIAGPGGKTITTRLAFEYSPAQHRISYHTLGAGDFETRAEYELKDEGPTTRMRFHETTRVTQQLPVPDSVIKRFIRVVFVQQLHELTRALKANRANALENHNER